MCNRLGVIGVDVDADMCMILFEYMWKCAECMKMYLLSECAKKNKKKTSRIQARITKIWPEVRLISMLKKQVQ